MNTKITVCAVVAMVVLVVSAAFDENERNAVRRAVSEAETRLKSAGALDGKAITLLPIRGDSDGFAEPLIIGAFVNAKKTCVTSNNENTDERLKKILEKIKWDEAQTTLKSIDPTTADELGHLKSTQIFIEARLDLFRRGRKRRAVAELNLLAYEVKTKQYVWTADIAVDASGRLWPDPSEYNVKVSFAAAEDDATPIAGLAATMVRNQVAGYGYRVDAEGIVDLELSSLFAQEVFDKSGEYVILKGVARARLASKTGDGVLYEKTFEARGKRGLGMSEAIKNLSYELSGQIRKWVDETLEPHVFFAKHSDFEAAGN